jgi:hypothetical protein
LRPKAACCKRYLDVLQARTVEEGEVSSALTEERRGRTHPIPRDQLTLTAVNGENTKNTISAVSMRE